jgi:beta-fructofuranosidase
MICQITSFNDTKNNRRIQYGWAWEDMNDFAITQQGFQGAFSLPRELFVKETRGVVYDLADTTPGNSRYIQKFDGNWTASTLGVRPAPDVVEGLRHGSHYTKYQCDQMKCDARQIVLPSKLSHSYEFKVSIKNTTGVTGVTIVEL